MSDEIFRVEIVSDVDEVRAISLTCQNMKHVQQVAYSTYHDRLTQICFTEKLIIYNRGGHQ